MPESVVSEWQVLAIAKHLSPDVWDEDFERNLGKMRLFTPELAKESILRMRDEKIRKVRHFLEAYVAVVQVTVSTRDELRQLASGTVVRESTGRVWKKFGTGWGAWFMVGDSLDYDANIIQLPVTVLYRPEAP